jgi:hypothetical protein
VPSPRSKELFVSARESCARESWGHPFCAVLWDRSVANFTSFGSKTSQVHQFVLFRMLCGWRGASMVSTLFVRVFFVFIHVPYTSLPPHLIFLFTYNLCMCRPSLLDAGLLYMFNIILHG